VLTVSTLDRAGYLKISWPAVREWLLEKGVDQSCKSCRLRCAKSPPPQPPNWAKSHHCTGLQHLW